MISQVGSTALAAGLVAAVLATSGWVPAARGRATAGWARTCTWTALLAAALAVGALETALVASDFSVRFVAENGGRAVPLYYRVTSLWSALEGSLLLWLLVLAAVAVLLATRPPVAARHLHPAAMAVVCAVAAAFFGLALFAGNAFQVVRPAPADGPGPNPLLQDHPAMGVHPPLLYVGFVGLVVPFAYATAALVAGDTGAAWTAAVRRWTLVCWSCLSAGIVLGAWWSYAVLGWGGYWAWDPVENASVLPWLTATALLHGMLVQARRPTLRLWNLSLAGASFVLVLVGTFLTRSGVLASVHAFTQSAIGPALLAVVVAVLAAFSGLLVWRADRLGPQEPVGGRLSRGTLLLANNVLLLCLAFTVLLGTLFPLVAEALTGDRLSVGRPYFDRMAPPLALVLVLLMAVGPLVRWDGDDAGALWSRLQVPGAVLAVVVAALGLAGARDPVAVLTCGLGAFALVAAAEPALDGVRRARRAGAGPVAAVGVALSRRRRLHGALLAHAGIALAAVAVAGSTAWSSASERTLAPGQQVASGGVTATLEQVVRGATGRGMSTAAVLRIGDRRVRPELTMYPARQVLVSAPAIASTGVRDVYVTLVEVAPDAGTATVRLAVEPLVPWLWVAGALVAAGGLLAAWPDRRRPPPVAQPPVVTSEPVGAR